MMLDIPACFRPRSPSFISVLWLPSVFLYIHYHQVLFITLYLPINLLHIYLFHYLNMFHINQANLMAGNAEVVVIRFWKVSLFVIKCIWDWLSVFVMTIKAIGKCYTQKCREKRRGRLRIRWIDQIRTYIEMRGGNWEEIQENRKWENRDSWKSLYNTWPISLETTW